MYIDNCLLAWRGSNNDGVRPAKSRDHKERPLDLKLEFGGNPLWPNIYYIELWLNQQTFKSFNQLPKQLRTVDIWPESLLKHLEATSQQFKRFNEDPWRSTLSMIQYYFRSQTWHDMSTKKTQVVLIGQNLTWEPSLHLGVKGKGFKKKYYTRSQS